MESLLEARITALEKHLSEREKLLNEIMPLLEDCQKNRQKILNLLKNETYITKR